MGTKLFPCTIKVNRLSVLLLFAFWLATLFPLKFAIITDSHLEIGNKLQQDTERRFSLTTQLLTNSVNRINDDTAIQFVVLVGDIINNGRSWNLDTAKFILDDLNMPYYVVMGNNDFATPSQGVGISKTTFNTAFADNMPNYSNGIWYKKVSDTLLIGIDNINPITGAEYWSEKLLHNLETIYSKYPGLPIFVFLHYPIMEYSFDPQSNILNSSKKFIELSKRYNVKLVCSGHYHYREIQQEENFISIVNSALVEFPHEYLTIEQSNSKIEIYGISVMDKFTLQESESLLQKRIRKLKYVFPNLNEDVFKRKITGQKEYYYENQSFRK